MNEMFTRAVLPDLHARMAEQGRGSLGHREPGGPDLGEQRVRTGRGLFAPRIAALDAAGGNPTIAFLASGMEGIKVRITAKAADDEPPLEALSAGTEQDEGHRPRGRSRLRIRRRHHGVGGGDSR
jgi:nicotinamide-nucleotide amidase